MLANTASSEAPPFKIEPPDPRLAGWLKDYPPSLFSETLYQSIELMERYSIELSIDLLHRLGLTQNLQSWRSADELCQLLSYQPRFSPALAWILERLIETGCIEAQSGGASRRYHLRKNPWQPDLDRFRTLALELDPANAATLDLLDHAASLYPMVAYGEQSGDLSLFTARGISLWLNYFHNDNPTYAVNNRVSSILAAGQLADKPRLRILEIGAGAGSASEALLYWLDQGGLLARVERCLITEPNAFFRRRAQRNLSKLYPSLPFEWGGLDLNKPWQTQGAASDEFDLVYAVNVMHISKNLLFSLNEARTSLNENGWLVMGECLRPRVDQPIYPELMFQILESFTQVETDSDIRPTPGFLTPEHWRNALKRADFQEIHVAPEVDSIHEIYPHFFIGAVCGQNHRRQ